MKQKRLIVTADDLGLIDSVNQAIEHCYHNGVVRSASLMANGQAFDPALELIRRTPGLSIGVHLALVNESPVLPPEQVPSLIEQNGRLPYYYQTFVKRYVTGRIDLNQVENEMAAQMKKIIDQGVRLDFINSHQHVHLLPGIFERVVALAKRFNICNIRFPERSSLNLLSPRQAVIRSMVWWARTKFNRSDLRATDHFFGMAQSGRLSEKALLDFLNRLPDGVTEVMSHPAYVDDVYLRDYKDYYDDIGFIHKPELELAALTSDRVQALINEKDIELVGFSDIVSSKAREAAFYETN